MTRTIYDARSIEDLVRNATRVAMSQILQRQQYNPDYAEDFVARMSGFVDSAPYVLRYHRAVRNFLDTAARLAAKEDATPQSLRADLLTIFTGEPQLSDILELDPEFNPVGFWAYNAADNIMGLIANFDKDKSFAQLCVLGETNSEGRTTLQNCLPSRVHLVLSYLPLDF